MAGFLLPKEQALRELVKWSVIGDYNPLLGSRSYSSALVDIVDNAQYDCNIEEKYRIDMGKERGYVEKIIEMYQMYIARLYFEGRLSLPKGGLASDRNAYFMVNLYNFLSEMKDAGRNSIEQECVLTSCKVRYVAFEYCLQSASTKAIMPKWVEKQLMWDIGDALAGQKDRSF